MSKDAWIPWLGGDCPVARTQKVHCRQRDGREDFGPITTRHGYPAGGLRWSHDSIPGDIIAYRVVLA